MQPYLRYVQLLYAQQESMDVAAILAILAIYVSSNSYSLISQIVNQIAITISEITGERID